VADEDGAGAEAAGASVADVVGAAVADAVAGNALASGESDAVLCAPQPISAIVAQATRKVRRIRTLDVMAAT
jgi:hypothetical protein